MKKLRIDKSEKASYTISFVSRLKSDGVKTITPMIIKDKLIAVLEELFHDGFIETYEVKAKGTKK